SAASPFVSASASASTPSPGVAAPSNQHAAPLPATHPRHGIPPACLSAVARAAHVLLRCALTREEVVDRVLGILKSHPKLTPEAHLEKDLGLHSLDTIEVVMAI
ncbi:unnamed protein product, partial [Urochloa humidicola]